MEGVNGAGNTQYTQTNREVAESQTLDFDSVNPNVADDVEAAAYAYEDRMGDLKSQFNNETDPDRKTELRQEMTQLKDAFEMLKTDAVNLTSTQWGSEDVRNAKMAPELRASVDEFRQLISESYAEFGTIDVPATMPESGAAEPITLKATYTATPLEVDEVVQNRSDSVSNNPSSGGVTADNVDAGDPEQMLELFDQDPTAFYDALQELPQEDRMQMLSFVQGQLQQANQMFSMMSNFAKSMHDTAKAAINNMRV